MTPDDVQRLGWVDEALSKQGAKRDISSVYQALSGWHCFSAEQDDLIVTIPSMSAKIYRRVVTPGW